MNQLIGRALLCFKDGYNSTSMVERKFYPLGNLLTRLLNENYKGKKIEFLEIRFASSETYRIFSVSPIYTTFSYRTVLRFHGFIDYSVFNLCSSKEQELFLWEQCYLYLQKAAKETNNSSLLIASELAYRQGLQINLDKDYKMVKTQVLIHGEFLDAAIWARYKEEGSIYAILTLEKNGQIFFEEELLKAGVDVEVFYVIYKAIEVINEDTLIIKGRKDAGYPRQFKIPPF